MKLWRTWHVHVHVGELTKNFILPRIYMLIVSWIGRSSQNVVYIWTSGVDYVDYAITTFINFILGFERCFLLQLLIWFYCGHVFVNKYCLVRLNI